MKNQNYKDVNISIRKLVKEKLNLKEDISEIADEFLFGVANGFDSTSLLELILELEDTFDVIIPDEDLIPDNFASISKITNYIMKLKDE